ncbi:hypothetical protein HYY70_00435 [Candidatus Woesearchaeota archaeon]|nr:hypothetical protein [Candidatus Woesearchaeota archaeon]
MRTKIPPKIFRSFPPEPDNRMRLMLNVLRHEWAQILLATSLSSSDDPKEMRRNLEGLCNAEISVPEIRRILREVLEPAYLVEIKAYLGRDLPAYSLSKTGQLYGVCPAVFTLKYSAGNNIALGDVLRAQNSGRPANSF